MMKLRYWLIIFCFLLLTSGCASVPTDPAEAAAYQEANDPWEPMNRKIFAFNMAADKYALRPIAKGYRAITTPGFRLKARTFLNNLKTPLTVVNDILQFNLKNAGLDLSRFIINSTLGFFGVYDVADKMGLSPNSQNLGTTMAVWDVPSGPYLVLPLLGPSNVRDASGMVGDIFLDPFYYVSHNSDDRDLKWGFWIVDGVGAIAAYENNINLLDEGKKSSLDFYAFMRSMYQQYRKKAIERAKGTQATDNQKANYEFSLEEDDEEDFDE
ncbi:MAG: VacJ family lipoprotein [Alphaproteobacteria bacterium]|nr:VacJ family lipoprotein [Alphaproteobacteria bacterium]